MTIKLNKLTFQEINETLKKNKIDVVIGNKCPISFIECPELDSLFDKTIIIKERDKVVACLGFSINKTKIHIDASCTETKSRNKGYNSLGQILLFYYAIYKKVPYMTSDANKQSQSIMKKLFLSKCSDEYMSPNYDFNCVVNVNDSNVRLNVYKNLEDLLKKIRGKKSRTIKKKSRSR